MAPFKRFWCCIIICIVLHLALVDCKKIDDFKSIVLKRSKRDTSLDDTRKIVDFTTNVVLGGISIALSISNPLFMIVSVFSVGTLIDLIWPASNSYQLIKANVIADIRIEMSTQAVAEMKMKLRDLRIQIRSVIRVLRVPRSKVEQWEKSVIKNGLSLNKQSPLLHEYKSHVKNSTLDYFKGKIIALATDVGNDGHHFHIHNDPTSSLAYYREFVTIQIGLWVAELMIHAGNDEDIRLKEELQNKIKITLQNHYKYVMWAIHKSATIIESKHRSRSKYKEVVNSWYKELPLDTWKQLTGYSGQSRFIRNSDVVSFKYLDDTSYRDLSYWMSCWGSGTSCVLRNCPGIDNPFDAGEENQFYFRCREEVFWIYRDSKRYNYIKACDQVAIQYSTKGDKHYWLSLHSRLSGFVYYMFVRLFFNTRTCPGTSFIDEPFYGRCSNEIFTIEVEGKTCGERIEDRDAIALKSRVGQYVSSWGLYLEPGRKKWWRIFKHDSYLKSADNNLMK